MNRIKTWTKPENIETLKAMWIAGYSIKDIAAALGATRMQVSRKGYKIGLPKRENATYSNKIAPVKKLPLQRNTIKPPVPLKTMAELTVAGSKPVTLDLRTGCCFPVNNGGPYLFCNMPSEGSYCTHHKAVMTDRPKYSHHGLSVRSASRATYV